MLKPGATQRGRKVRPGMVHGGHADGGGETRIGSPVPPDDPERGFCVLPRLLKRTPAAPDGIAKKILGKIVQLAAMAEFQPDIPVLEAGQGLVIKTESGRGGFAEHTRGMSNWISDQCNTPDVSIFLRLA